jgi:hypothetical protein
MGREEVTGGLGAASSLGAVSSPGASCSTGLQAIETLGVIGRDDVPNSVPIAALSSMGRVARSVMSSLSAGFEKTGQARR